MREEQTPRLPPSTPKGQLYTGASGNRSSGGGGGGLAAQVGEGISSPSPPPLGSWLPSEDLCAVESASATSFLCRFGQTTALPRAIFIACGMGFKVTCLICTRMGVTVLKRDLVHFRHLINVKSFSPRGQCAQVCARRKGVRLCLQGGAPSSKRQGCPSAPSAGCSSTVPPQPDKRPDKNNPGPHYPLQFLPPAN